MRKLFLLFWALLATTCLWAHNFEVDGIYYNYLDDNNVAVTYKGSSFGAYDNEYSGEVTIPETVTYDGITYNVTSIGNGAFYECRSLTSVTIPNSVTSIGDAAFYQCSSLTSITIPNSVTSIGDDAFYGCSSLTSVTIPNSVTSIGDGAFSYCSSLTSITIPNSVTSIGDGAFSGCSSLTLVTIPNNVTSIGDYAFSGCSSLTSITIPNSVTSIGDGAFHYCSSLASIAIPNSVTSIGSVTFSGCSSLSLVTLTAPSVEAFCNGQGNNLLRKAGCHASRKIAINGEIITSITIPNSVTSIGEHAFYDCSSLTLVTIPNSVTSIGEYAFEYCRSLTSITIPNSVTSIGDGAFSYCSSLTSVTIPNSVTSIGTKAFQYCSSLDTIHVEATTPPTFERNTFINTPTSICYIPCGKKSVYEASAWAQYMGELVEYIPELTSGFCGENLYWEYADTKLTISGTGAMYDNIVECFPWAWLLESIRSIEMSEGITHIAAYAFYGCSALRELHLPASVLTIGEYAFGNTPRLYEITCLAPEPPVADISSFTNYDAYLHAYCDAQRYYSIDPIWKNFHNIECIVTENEVTGDVTITPSDYEATVVWLSHADAAAYALVITKNDVTFCTLKFNKYGQLTNIAFAPSRTHQNKQQTAEATSTGYSFTITGLDENTTYGYAFSVLNEESAVIEEFVGEFTTQSNVSSAVDNVDASNHSTQKLLRNGQLIIVRDGVEYNAMGQEM